MSLSEVQIIAAFHARNLHDLPFNQIYTGSSYGHGFLCFVDEVLALHSFYCSQPDMDEHSVPGGWSALFVVSLYCKNWHKVGQIF